ncbi:recombinase family protein [Nonomuraea wenchangensis]|uniref:recombinase family protein n=1 Tax=Nonomuraea wenchangensis TaxID=568860 RepID=UPI003316A604
MAEPNMDRVHARLTAALLRMTPPDVAAPFFRSPAWTDLTPAEQAMIIDADADMEEQDRRRRQQARQERAEKAQQPVTEPMTEPVTGLAEPSNAIRVGYARVSTRGQDHAAQLELLGAADCREIVEETISTRRKDRPKLQATLAMLKAGDTLVITKPDRVARSVKELLAFLEDELAPRGINLHILTGICAGIHRPTGQSIADKMLFMVAAMAAEMERDLISERILEGLDAARAAGRVGGRPAAVTDDVLAAARARRGRGQSVTQIARELSVGRSTLYRALENDDPDSATG